MAANRRGRRDRAWALALGVALLVFALPGSAAARPTWLPARDLPFLGENAHGLSIGLDGAGDAFAVWATAGPRSTVGLQASERIAGGDWSAPHRIQTGGLDDEGLQVAVNPAGAAVAVWAQLTNSGIAIEASSRLARGRWGAPHALSVGAGDLGSLRVALDRRGDAVAVWDQLRFEGPKDEIGTVRAAVRPAHRGWRAATNLSPAGANAGASEVALDAAGDAVAVWVQDVGDTAGGIIRSARRPAGGTWGAPHGLSSPKKDSWSPRVAVDAAGDAVAVWSGYDNVVRAARRPAGGAWGAARVLSGGSHPAVAADPAGDFVAVWEGASGLVESAVLQAHRAWSAPAVVSSPSPGAFPDVALDAQGDAVAVWIGFNGARQQVERASRRPAGRAWGKPKTLSAAGGDALSSNVLLDRRGDGIAFWDRSVGTRDTVQAAGLDASGPVLARISIPRHANPAERLRFSVSPFDVWSRLAGAPRWSFGDGASARGTTVSHTYRTAGRYTVRVSQSDSLGNRSSVSRSIRIGRRRS